MLSCFSPLQSVLVVGTYCVSLWVLRTINRMSRQHRYCSRGSSRKRERMPNYWSFPRGRYSHEFSLGLMLKRVFATAVPPGSGHIIKSLRSLRQSCVQRNRHTKRPRLPRTTPPKRSRAMSWALRWSCWSPLMPSRASL